MKTRYKDKHDNPIYTGDVVWVEWDDISYEGVIEEEGGMIVCVYYDIGEREPLPLKWFPKCKRDILTEKEARRYWKTAMLGDEPPKELYRKEIYRNARGFAAEIPDEAEAVASEIPASRQVFTEIPPKKAKAAVDHGKIISLDNAGWSVTQIAREVGCSEQSVRNHIAREK